MDAIVFIILAFLAVLVLASIPILVSLGIFKLARNKISITSSIILASVLPLVCAYYIYEAFYPGDEFYKYEFKTITKLDFPLSGEILKKDASYPTFQGEYCSSALIRCSKNDYEVILKSIRNNNHFTCGEVIGSSQFDYVANSLDLKQIEYQYIDSLEYNKNNKYYFIGFLNDKKSMIIHLVND